MNVFEYKGFMGSISVNAEDKCLYGKLLHVNDLITYEAETVADLEKAFHESVENYLETCIKHNKEPLKPFKGSFNVRVGTELHTKAARHAAVMGITLNEYIKQALQRQIKSDR